MFPHESHGLGPARQIRIPRHTPVAERGRAAGWKPVRNRPIQRRVLLAFILDEIPVTRRHQRLEQPGRFRIPLFQFFHGVHHRGIVARLARRFRQIIEALRVGLRPRDLQRFQIAQGGKRVTRKKIDCPDPRFRIIAIHSGQRLGKRLILRPRLLVLLRVQPLLAALQLLPWRSHWKSRSQCRAQTLHTQPGLRRKIGIRIPVVDPLIRYRGLRLLTQRFISHRQRVIPIRLRQYLIVRT